MTTVLVADPDRSSRRLIAAALRSAGYTVETAKDAGRAASVLRRRRPDAVVVDPATAPPHEPVVSLRAQTDIPIVVVNGSDALWDKVAVLDAGADDYLAKPFGVEELLARLRVALRRAARPAEHDAPMRTADFTVHLADRRWKRSDGVDVPLTPTEWRVVETLVQHAGHLVTYTELLQAVWGPKAVEKTHYLRVQMAAIRRKVEPDPARPKYFITVPGLGLRFEQGTAAMLQPC